jgi:hypothetical protein
MSLPAQVIREDRQLEKARESTAETLMRHRWHWTLDESNPDRVSMREYARAVGRSFSTINADATGYALTQGDRDIPISQARERANMGAETQPAGRCSAPSGKRASPRPLAPRSAPRSIPARQSPCGEWYGGRRASRLDLCERVRPLEVGVEQPGGLLLVAGHHVPVAVERDRDVRVPHVG